MNHRPFEDWLFEETPLSPSQKRLLDAHLRECSSCLALAEVGVVLRSARIAGPSNGFVNRFRQRLVARQQEQRRRFILGVFLLALTVGSALIGLAWPFLSAFSANPGRMILEWVSYVVMLCLSLQTLFETLQVLARIGISLIPSQVWMVTFLLLSAMCAIGIVSLAKMIRIPQGVRL